MLKRDFLHSCIHALNGLAREVGDTPALVGTPELGEDVFNSAALLHRGKVVAMYRKCFLPNHGVFDESRYFAPGREGLVVRVRGTRVGITICEDIWHPGGPLEWEVAFGGAEVVVNISASPYHRGKQGTRERLVQSRAIDAMAVVAYVNCIGGQDELVFDGGSFVRHPRKGKLASSPRFREHLLLHDPDPVGLWVGRISRPLHRYTRQGALPETTRVIELNGQRGPSVGERPPLNIHYGEEGMADEEEVLQALLLGLRDYVRKNGFREVVIGLSGGIDSSLVASLAVMALGKDRVHGVFMPSRFTSGLSWEGVRGLVDALEIDLEEHPIEDILASFIRGAGTSLRGAGENVAVENLQSRIRGNMLMSISNSRGWLVLATGNKSEFSMGYCTLYGDMAGGYAEIKDLFKEWVYRLSPHINSREGREIIPAVVLEREPSAELRENQRGSDTIPPYELLDPILEDYIENGLTVEEMVAKGYVLRFRDRLETRTRYPRRRELATGWVR